MSKCGYCNQSTTATNNLGPKGQPLCGPCKTEYYNGIRTETMWASRPRCSCGSTEMLLQDVSPIRGGSKPQGTAFWQCSHCGKEHGAEYGRAA
jgi:hypothetical protein